jgi:DnaJ-class molecular chaperone
MVVNGFASCQMPELPEQKVGQETMTCNECKGKGYIEISEGEAIRAGHPEIEGDRITCLHCGGSGEINEEEEYVHFCTQGSK